MVQVGLARPDRADHVVVLVELVEPGAALVVDDMFVDILGERGIPVAYISSPVAAYSVAEVFNDSASVQCMRSVTTGLPFQSVV